MECAVPLNVSRKKKGQMNRTGNVIQSLRLVAGFGLAGAVLAGLTLGWMPGLSALSVQDIGGLLGIATGTVASLRQR